MALRDVTGHRKAVDILKSCIIKGRIPHALLFAGDEGIGKKLTAVNFAKALNCMNAGGGEDLSLFGGQEESQGAEQPDACDQCPSCMKIEKGSHPDFFLVGPESDGGQITVSSVRKIEEALSYKPFEGKWKIAVIDNADRLNQSAANAFLQTLEEPAAESILILVSSRPGMILPTIRSRCQTINFTPLPVDLMCGLLEERFDKGDHDRAMLLSMLSGGRLGYALDEDLIMRRDWSFDIVLRMLGRLEEDVWEGREDMETWFEWAQLWLREIAVFKATGRTDLLINSDRAHEIKKIAGSVTLRNVLKLAREFYNIRGRLNFNLNKQLTLNYATILIKKTLGETNAKQ